MPSTVPAAYELIPAAEPAVPLILDSPHSGTEYPDDFTTLVEHSRLRGGEDTDVEKLFAAAPRLGAPLLHALFPRTYIDPNRAEDDLDPDLLDGPWPVALHPGEKVDLGIGLVWAKLPPDGTPLYAAPLPVAAVQARIERYWRPYRRALARMLDDTAARFGRVLHLDCHSMPALSGETSPEGPGSARPEINLGDRGGTTCDPAITARIAEHLRDVGFEVAVNVPYRGADLVRASGDPTRGRHSLQIEINRKLYMHEATRAPNARFSATQAALTGLLERLCADLRRGVVLAP